MNLIIALIGGSLAMPLVAVAIVIAFVFLGVTVASRYKRVAPNEIGVFYGRKHKVRGPDGQVVERGYRTVTGGGSILWPIFERYQVMSMAAFQVEVQEQNIPSAKNVGVNIGGVAACQISSTPEDQNNAVAAFLGKSEDEIKEFVVQILKGHIRSIIGKLTVEEILRDRTRFNEMVVAESQEEFRKLGLKIVTLVIQEVNDTHGYINALGQKEIAAALRDAKIQTAEAERDSDIKVSNAKREASAIAAENAAKVAEAERDRDLKIAENTRLVASKKAEADAAGQLAKAAQDKQIRIAEAQRDQAATEAQIAVQEKERVRKEKELEATKIVTAEADRKATLITAEGSRQAAEIEARRIATQAEGQRNAAVTTGEGEAKKRTILATAEAEATRVTATAQAESTRATMSAQAEGSQKVAVATAEGEKAKLLATAEGEKARLIATAEGERLRLNAIAEGKQNALLAEAKGTAELADALKKMDERGQLILVLDRLPNLIDKGGDAGAKIMAQVFGPMGQGISKIGNIQITDLGGGKTTGDAFESLATIIPNTVVKFLATCRAQGIDATPLLGLVKADGSGLQKMLGMAVGLTPPAAPSTNGGDRTPGVEPLVTRSN